MEPATIAILAGGLATRMGELTKRLPKSLLDVAGRPFLAWQLELLAAQGLCDVVMCLGHHGDQIESWVRAHPVAGVRVRFSHDGPHQLGTGGALRKALPLLGDTFLVTYGDSYLRCDYSAVLRRFLELRAWATPPPRGLMTVYENGGAYDASNVIYDQGRIVRYDKRVPDPRMRHIDWGLGVLRADAFEGFATDRALDLADVYTVLCDRGQLAGYAVDQRFYEIGSARGLAELSEVIPKIAPAQGEAR